MISAGLARAACDITTRPLLCGCGVLRRCEAHGSRSPGADVLQTAFPDAPGPAAVQRAGAAPGQGTCQPRAGCRRLRGERFPLRVTHPRLPGGIAVSRGGHACLAVGGQLAVGPDPVFSLLTHTCDFDTSTRTRGLRAAEGRQASLKPQAFHRAVHAPRPRKPWL